MLAFVSHSKEDRAIYSALSICLDSAGVIRWDPATMSPTESLAEQLRDAIRKCNLCIFLATRRSVVSRWCLAEVGAFWGAGKKIFLFVGEPDLNDDELPPQFRGGLWTSDARVLLNAIREEPNDFASSVFEHPSNVFWLANDLARAIRSGMFEPQQRGKLIEKIRQAIHHLDECGLQVPHARDLLLKCLSNVKTIVDLSDEQRKQLVDAMAGIKNEIGGAIERLQMTFKGYPTMEQTVTLDQHLERWRSAWQPLTPEQQILQTVNIDDAHTYNT